MGMSGISKSQVSRLCEEIDERVEAFLERPLEGEWPYLWIDATYLKVRQAGRIVGVAVNVAVAQAKAKIQPDGMLNYRGRKTMAGAGNGRHPSTLPPPRRLCDNAPGGDHA
ncbi:hypothetical protein GCM10007874_50180 [Labrys miyagiensis]|uniref:Mutator family transposase n=1 Tax=Labrys miyagiensis TaxID=346912 RepID=A0ABQ6CNQ0_9HYPH|nr:hypothetical protein GCM10007874_50180 [Labrys miyagiensis]